MENKVSFERNKEKQAAQITKIKPRWHQYAIHTVYYLIMIVLVVFYMLPFWGTITTSLKSNNEVMTSSPVAWPQEITAEGYVSAFEALAGPLGNSLIITLGGALGSVFLGSICAYGIGKWKFKMNNLFFILLVAATYFTVSGNLDTAAANYQCTEPV